jgi:hypothetical protein
MRKTVMMFICSLAMISTLVGCSSVGDGWFQTNDKPAPFNLFHLFDTYPALDQAWDSVPGNMGNHKMAAMMTADLDGTAEFLAILSYLMDRADNPGLGMLDDLKTLLSIVQDDSERFYGNNQKGITPYNIHSFYGDGNAATYLNDFYGFLDEITSEVTTLSTPGIGPSVIGIANKVTPYTLSKTPADLQKMMEEMYMTTFYQHIDYNVGTTGYSVRLPEGTYTTAQMTTAGLVNNDITSLKVPFGYKVTLYDNDNFTGTATVFDSSSKFVGASVNDTTSSIKIEKDPSAMTDLAELAAGPLAIADYPMWITQGASPGLDTLITDYASMPSGTDSDLGNMSAGLSSIMYGLINLMNGETVDRASMYDLIDNLNTVVNDPEIVKRLMWNISNYFTTNGSIYGTLNTTNTNVATNQYNTDNPGVLYSNTELAENLRQILAGSSGLLLRNDRRASMVWKSGTTDTSYPLATLLSNAKKIYMDWDHAQIKESIYDLIRYDAFGRDRRTDVNALEASHLEHLLYVGALSGNIGFAHGGNKNELENTGNSASFEGVANAHGHGEGLGYLTLNDSLFAMQGGADDSMSWMGIDPMGTYDLAFESDGRNKGRDRTFRRSTSFTDAQSPNYKFQFDWNYPALQFLSGACVGDAGVSTDGSLHGGNNSGNLTNNQYIPYSANGTYTRDLSSWTFGWIIRSCWEGEGPYYSTQGATQSGNVYTYYRPDGKIYAYVTKTNPGDAATWTYVYPVDASYDKVDPADAGQRWNRYKATWNTDYYMIRGEDNNNYVPRDSTGDTIPDTSANPQCRTYTEMIPEKSANRECASFEEAMYRNFQYVILEKKIVFVVPLWLRVTVMGICNEESALFQIIEGNGLAGLSAARLYRGNGVWAKLNAGSTRDDSVQSTIPGDYRMLFMSKALQGVISIDTAKVISLLGNGSATPAAVGQNLAAIARFGFPQSPLISSGSNYEHKFLGSRKVANPSNNTDAGFEVGDPVWRRRNAVLPLLITLLAPMRAQSYVVDPFDATKNRNALAVMLEGLGALVKPWSFFNYNVSSGVAQNTWLPRTRGNRVNDTLRDYNYEHSKYLLPDRLVSGFIDSTSNKEGWSGGNATQRYFAPPAMPTLLSMLLDSDTTTNRSTAARRADGLLGKLVEYDVAAGRPTVTETPWTVAPAPPDAVAVNRLCYGLEQMSTAMKGTKSKGTQIYEDMSNTTGTITRVTKSMDPPEWMFQKRVRPDNPAKYVDMDLDDVLSKAIGSTNTEGIRQFHDGNTTYGDGTGDPSWVDLTNVNDDGALDNIQFLVSNFVLQSGPYAITEHVFDIIDVVMQHNPTEAQVKGLLYTLGKLLAYYDGNSSKWLLQGDTGFDTLFNLMTTALPTIDREMGLYSAAKGVTKGETYHTLMSSSQYAMAPDGLVEYIMDKVSIDPYSSGDMVSELSQFLDSRIISDSNTPFFSVISQMLGDMSELVGNAPTEEGLYLIYEHYGFERMDN